VGTALPTHGQPKKGGDDVYDEGNASVAEARDHFNKGIKLNAAGNVEAALGEFQKAYDLIPNWKILYNIGQTSRHVHDYARSLKAFERYLAEGKDDVAKPRRAEVEGELKTLRPLVGKLEIVASPDGAKVTVETAVVGNAPLAEPVLANAGHRKVKVEKDGMAPVTKEVDVPGGGEAKIEIQLVATAPVPTATATATATPTASATTHAPPSDHRGIAKLAWIATGVFAVGAAATGTIALIESKSLADTAYAGPDRKPPPDSDLRSKASLIDTFAIVTDVLVGAAVVSAGFAVYFTFFDGGSSQGTGGPAEPPKKATAHPAPRASLRLGPTGATVVGTF